MSTKKKLEIFEKVNRGEVRVVLGSTFTLGTGVNIQERLHTLIHVDAPNRPMDYTQRNGRIHRQGNIHKDMGKPVRILRFGVEDSLDVTAYQRLKTKGAIADSIMNGKQMMENSMTNRVLEEEEDVFGDTVAQLSGSEYAMLKNNAERNVRKYASRKKQWEADQTYIHNAKPRVKAFIKDAEKRIEDNSRYLEAVRSSFPDGKFKEIVIGKHRFTTIDAMEDFFKEHNKSLLAEMKQMKDGEIADEQKRQLTIQIGDFSFVVTTKLTRQTVRDGATLFNDVERKMTYSCAELGIEDIPVRQNLLRNAIEDITYNVITGRDFSERLEAAERSKKHNEAELEQLLSREGKPFEYEAELEQAKAQYKEYTELMKKELEEKEAKYAEMDATVEAANDLASAEEADELEREGYGSYSDDELSMANDDPVARMYGESSRSKKQQRQFAERMRRYMRQRVQELSARLNVDIEIVEDASTLEGRRATSKGFYNKRTGKITVVLSNNRNIADVEQTVFHEAVGHYGLRRLLGEQFDRFLDNVYEYAEPDIRERIARMALRNGFDIRKATEEYLAMLAEDTELFRNTPAQMRWFAKIKRWFAEVLHTIGFKYLGSRLSDNELRYYLWLSYENLQGRLLPIFQEASEMNIRQELGLNNYGESLSKTSEVAETEQAELEVANEKFNEELSDFKENKHKGLLHLGKPMKILKVAGVNSTELTLSPKVLHQHLKKHNLSTDDLVDLSMAIQNPILVYKHGKTHPNIVIVTDHYVKGGKLSIAVKLDSEGNVLEVDNISSIHSKDAATELSRLGLLDEDSLKESLRWVEKGKVSEWLGLPYEEEHQANPKLYTIAKIIENFENPTISDKKSLEEEGIMYRNEEESPLKRYERKTRRPTTQNKVGILENFGNRFIEAYQDNMHSFKVLQESISQSSGKAVKPHEDAYTAENRMSSENKAQAEIYHLFWHENCTKSNEILKL